MATINININSSDTININVANNNQQPSAEDKNVLYNRLQADLNKHYESVGKWPWYEVWIDFDECFDSIYEQIKDMCYQAQYDTCLGFIVRRAAFYDGDGYIDMLNELVSQH